MPDSRVGSALAQLGHSSEDTRDPTRQVLGAEKVAPCVDASKTLARGRHPVERAFVFVDRYAAWLSAILLFLFFLSGFGMDKPAFLSRVTGGLITWRVSYDMHTLLDIPLMVVFSIHTISGIRRALLRHTKRRARTAWVAAGVGTAMFGFLLMLVFAPTGF
jgi:succinate dehydrogenase hydrophobic anchor subunit